MVVEVLLVVLIVGVLLDALVADLVCAGDEPPVLVPPEQPVNKVNKVPNAAMNSQDEFVAFRFSIVPDLSL